MRTGPTLSHPLQRWLTELLNLFLVPEDRDAFRPWGQLLLFLSGCMLLGLLLMFA